ncbi:MAG TPA: SDR family oxidoreductase [Anaerolineales bacterium]|nr:SDR family oxidoreductase [Anaerolineales bacterium]
MRLQNKVALITGGTSGIGKATVELFLQEGARVAFTGRRTELGSAIQEQTGALFIQADHRFAADCQVCVEKTLQTFGSIHILFNNAGIVTKGTAESISEQDWQDTLDINITAVWRMSRLVIPIFRAQGGGVIVNNASDWGLVGATQAVAYAASKGAVIQMTRSMALDHAKENIRVNAVCPGDTFVERWLQDGYFRNTEAVSVAEARHSDNTPLGRVAEAEEIARAVLFLASDESSFITGTTLVVDGGNTAQ